jgi:protein-disulfide isomerase
VQVASTQGEWYQLNAFLGSLEQHWCGVIDSAPGSTLSTNTSFTTAKGGRRPGAPRLVAVGKNSFLACQTLELLSFLLATWAGASAWSLAMMACLPTRSHSQAAKVIRPKPKYEVRLSRPARERSRRLALGGRLQMAGIVAAALLLGVSGFAVLRQAAQRILSHRGSEGQRTAVDAVVRHHANADESCPASTIAEAIADAQAWQPPVAVGSPSPLDAHAALSITTGDHALGSHRAPITLMLFGDLQCRYALHVFQVLYQRVQDQPTEYRLVWRERPLDIHPDASAMAIEAERLSLQFGEPAFWRFVRAVSQLPVPVTPIDAKTIARALQSDTAKINESVAGERATTQIEKDQRVAMTYAIHATPTVFINGLRIEGDFTEPEIDETIEEELDAVDLLQQEPVPQAKIYAIRVHANLLDLDLE